LQMAVIKMLDTIGHISESGVDITAGEAISIIKLRKERSHYENTEMYYVGEKGRLEVDIEKLGCPFCQKILGDQLGKEREV
jgi:hypothetical protein